ncbi:MAG: hypothetical protein QXR97_00070 [Thermoproteota archaeon]
MSMVMIQIVLWEHGFEAFRLLRTILPIVLLSNAALQDLRHRELNASAWFPMIIMGIVFLGVELATSPRAVGIIVRLVITLVILLLPYFLHLYELGDVIVIISLSLTHISTTEPILGGFFIIRLFPDFGLTMLWNTELIMLFLVLLKTIYELASGNWGKRKVGKHSPDSNVSLNLVVIRKNENSRASFFKQETPLISFLLPGYVLTILFGSIFPLPF